MIQCPRCGKDNPRKDSKYCSMECYARSKIEARPKTAVCAHCGITWDGYDMFNHKRKYCSARCSYDAKYRVNEVLEMFEDGTCTVAIHGGTMLCDCADLDAWHAAGGGHLSIHKKGYAVGRISNKPTKFHRFVLPDAAMPDHANRNKLDNRRCNVRAATPELNQANQSLSKSNTSGYKGVTGQEACWHAQIGCRRLLGSKRIIRIGTFDTAEEAARAYDAKALELFGPFAATNKSLGLLKD